MLQVPKDRVRARHDLVARTEPAQNHRLAQIAHTGRHRRRHRLAIHQPVHNLREGLGLVDLRIARDDLAREILDPPSQHRLSGHLQHIDHLLDRNLGVGGEPDLEPIVRALLDHDLSLDIARPVAVQLSFKPNPLDQTLEHTVWIRGEVDVHSLPGLDQRHIGFINAGLDQHLAQVGDLHDDGAGVLERAQHLLAHLEVEPRDRAVHGGRDHRVLEIFPALVDLSLCHLDVGLTRGDAGLSHCVLRLGAVHLGPGDVPGRVQFHDPVVIELSQYQRRLRPGQPRLFSLEPGPCRRQPRLELLGVEAHQHVADEHLVALSKRQGHDRR